MNGSAGNITLGRPYRIARKLHCKLQWIPLRDAMIWSEIKTTTQLNYMEFLSLLSRLLVERKSSIVFVKDAHFTIG